MTIWIVDRPAKPRTVCKPRPLASAKTVNGKPKLTYTGKIVQPNPALHAPAVPPTSAAPHNHKATSTNNTEEQDIGAWDRDCK